MRLSRKLLESDHSELEEQYARIHEQLVTAQARIEQLKEKRGQKEAEISSLQTTIVKKIEWIAELVRINAKLTEEAAEAQATTHQYQNALSDSNQTIRTQATRIDSQIDEIGTLSRELRQVHSDHAMESELRSSTEERLAHALRDLEELQSERKDPVAELGEGPAPRVGQKQRANHPDRLEALRLAAAEGVGFDSAHDAIHAAEAYAKFLSTGETCCSNEAPVGNSAEGGPTPVSESMMLTVVTDSGIRQISVLELVETWLRYVD